MEEKKAKRKLTAILSADVKGYSHLMQDDEEATVRTIKAYRGVMSSLIQEHDGRVVDAKGDNILAEFPSVVDAVRCGVGIQKELKVRNEELTEKRKMEFRIGINLGDVIEEEETIYGDGVNIAARLEGIAEGGGICISRTAFDQVKNKLNLGYENLGEHSVKNIAEPVRVYRVLMEPEAAGKVIGEKAPKPKQWRWAAIAIGFIIMVGALAIWNFYFRPPPIEPASLDKMALPLPDKPSIAVLPFDNMSGDPEQDYLGDGIAEDIITQLSQYYNLFVIARNSSFSYKGKKVKVRQVAEELGVRYVLEGSVQKSGDQVRITAQLVDAITGKHLWAHRYDSEVKDFFTIQDEITREVVTELAVKLVGGEAERKWLGIQNLEAWTYFRKSIEQLRRFNPEGFLQARKLSKKTIELDPNFSGGYIMLGWTYVLSARMGFSKSPKEDLERAEELANKCLALNDSDPIAPNVLGYIYLARRQHDKAIQQGQRGIALAPSMSDSHAFLADFLIYAGRSEEAIGEMTKAMRLAPFYPAWYLWTLGQAYYLAGRFEEAIAAYKESQKRIPNHLNSALGMAVIYSASGREEQARAEAAEVLRLYPKFSLQGYEKILLYKNKAVTQRIIEALRKAGLPETTPLPLPDKPSIAVLPFVNMSGDPEQEYFSDGISEEIITALSKNPTLFVIARTSSFKYKGKDVDLRSVGRELGVRYVLEGSVRKANDKVRITAQLIDAKTNSHIWAERYDRELKDIFELQDEIMRNILTEMRVQLTDGVQARLYMKKFQEKKIGIEVFDKHMQSLWHFYRMNPEGFSMARQLAEEAIEIDPNYAPPYTVLAFTHLGDIRGGRSKSPRKSMALAEKFAQKALQLDDSNPMTLLTLGQIHLYKRQHEKAIAEGKKALALCPNSADVHSHLGHFLYYAGRYEEATPFYEKAIRLNPYPPIFYYHRLASAYANVGRYDESIDLCKKTLKRAPNYTTARLVLAMVYIWQGREEEAHAEAAEFLRIKPSFTLKRMKAISLHKNKEDLKRRIEALRKAGLPE